MVRTADKEQTGIESLRAASTLVSSKRRSLFVCIGVLAVLCSCLDYFAPLNNNRVLYSDVITLTSAGLAFTVSLQIIHRQKLNGTFPRLFGFLGLGLGLWFVAEAIWDYFELVAGIDTPFPSIADAVWLAGYIPFFGFVFGMVKSFPGSSRMYRDLLIMLGVALAVIAYPLMSIFQQSDLHSTDGLIKFIVSSLYPISDVFLLVPTAMMFIRLRTGAFTFTPWAYLVLAVMLFVVGDIGFALFSAKGGMDDMLWIWDPLYQVGYLAIACSLIWHETFFTVNAKKILKAWQKANR